MRVILDGEPVDESSASISVFDWAVIRGFGVFEVVRSYQGSLFRLDAHLDRLARSAEALAMEPPDLEALAADMTALATEYGDGEIRAVLTGGGRDGTVSASPRTIVIAEPVPDVPDRLKIIPMLAPWHPATDSGGFSGVKWTSYAPNMATTDRARRAGFDDALLVTEDTIVLEGPTFTCAWVCEGRLETPSLALGILGSITREVMLECAERLDLEVKQGRFPLDRMIRADEIVALSTVKQVTPVSAVGEHEIAEGPIASKLASTFADIVSEETGFRP